MAVLRPAQHDDIGFMPADEFMGVKIKNYTATALVAADPVIFRSVNADGEIVAALVTASGTVSGSTSTFDQLPNYKVLGFADAAVATNTQGTCYICGMMLVNVMATVATGKPLKFGDGGGATAGMIQGTYTDVGKIRAFSAAAVGAGGGTITAIVLPWNI